LPYFYCQQAGARPSFVGVAAVEASLGAAFLQELICGGWSWARLRRRSHLFVVRQDKVEVFVGTRARRELAMTRQASAVILPLARLALEGEALEAARRDAARARLPQGDFWYHNELTDALRDAASVACEADGDQGCVVAGALDQDDAEALARELRGRGLWRPEELGSVAVWLGRDGIRVLAEQGNPLGLAKIRDFAADFCESVVVSDLHLGLPHRDSFGHAKAEAFCQLLRGVIRRRSRLVINGDFLELQHERYGAIKRAYPEIFELLPRVRRILYLSGNHDTGVLQDQIKETRRAVRAQALAHAYAELRLGLDGNFRFEPHQGALRRVPHENSWLAWLQGPRLRESLMEILRLRGGRIFVSHGFPEEGVAFKRLGPRDTPEEQPQWFLDDSLLARRDATEHLLKLLADRRQRLDRVIQADCGRHVAILRYHLDLARNLYFEHGHVAFPACRDGGVGGWVSAAAGWLKRLGFRGIEHWVEEDLGRRLQAIHPFYALRELKLLAERLVAVGTALRALHPDRPPPLILCGHTHETAQVGLGPVHAFVQQTCGARYANSGAWSSRFRLRRPGADRGEWLTLAADGTVSVHATGPGGMMPQPSRTEKATAGLESGGANSVTEAEGTEPTPMPPETAPWFPSAGHSASRISSSTRQPQTRL
jgi:UDP-2,3-diacylglucosamine pyrophosphatase LpxH